MSRIRDWVNYQNLIVKKGIFVLIILGFSFVSLSFFGMTGNAVVFDNSVSCVSETPGVKYWLDYDENNRIDAVDLQKVSNIILGTRPQPANLCCIDKSKNGRVDAVELQSVQNIILGIDGSKTEVCPTCSDGIKNGNELGTDCGGSCATCLTPSCDSYVSGESRIKGDFNGDEVVNSKDVDLIRDLILGRITKPNNLCCVDLNDDNQINAVDLQKVFNLNLDQSLPRNRCPVREIVSTIPTTAAQPSSQPVQMCPAGYLTDFKQYQDLLKVFDETTKTGGIITTSLREQIAAAKARVDRANYVKCGGKYCAVCGLCPFNYNDLSANYAFLSSEYNRKLSESGLSAQEFSTGSGNVFAQRVAAVKFDLDKLKSTYCNGNNCDACVTCNITDVKWVVKDKNGSIVEDHQGKVYLGFETLDIEVVTEGCTESDTINFDIFNEASTCSRGGRLCDVKLEPRDVNNRRVGGSRAGRNSRSFTDFENSVEVGKKYYVKVNPESVSIEVVQAVCGNEVVDSRVGEQCDDGNLIETDSCNNLCKLIEVTSQIQDTSTSSGGSSTTTESVSSGSSSTTTESTSGGSRSGNRISSSRKPKSSDMEVINIYTDDNLEGDSSAEPESERNYDDTSDLNEGELDKGEDVEEEPKEDDLEEEPGFFKRLFNFLFGWLFD